MSERPEPPRPSRGGPLIVIGLLAALGGVVGMMFMLQDLGRKWAGGGDAVVLLVSSELAPVVDASLHAFAAAEEVDVARTYLGREALAERLRAAVTGKDAGSAAGALVVDGDLVPLPPPGRKLRRIVLAQSLDDGSRQELVILAGGEQGEVLERLRAWLTRPEVRTRFERSGYRWRYAVDELGGPTGAPTGAPDG